MLLTLLAATALLALPVGAQASHGDEHGKGKAKAHAKGKSKTKSNKRCKKAPKVGYSVHGTLVNFTADDPATTDKNEGSLTITVTEANSHATKSGALADQDAATEGNQVEGGTYTLNAADDAFDVVLQGFEGTDTPSAGDAVHVSGKVARTKSKCTATGASRYGTPDVRKATITDSDADVAA